ncbi:hypothetical protein BKA61DRAFT_669786 [Leptodontidium sp. MPI-SDFR-AT-0119]|nr:hypothetical protein BKA61DRAFT_669786 [Leptodontidium sp. MPI-SDFR-AT-0119]
MLPQQQAPLDVERARVRDLMRYGPVSTPCSVACLYYYIQKAESPIDASLANYRYYKPKVKSQKPSISSNCAPDVVPEDCTNAGPVSMPALEEPETPDCTQLLSHDSTLTAFAQLGACRLDCQRSFISLMDHESQYILAEATRSVSLLSQEECNPGNEVYLGPRILDLTWGICPNTIQVFTARDGSLNISTAHVTATPNFYVMNDLSAIDSFKDRPYVSGWPHMRFYVEVPITSPAGHVIGTFCVVDNKPRDGIDEKGLAVLTEISAAIMRHLELVQMQNHFNRADQMLKGLGMFVEKKSIPAQWASGHGYDSTNLSRLSSLQPGTAHTVISSSENAPSDHGTILPTTVTSAPEAMQKPISRTRTLIEILGQRSPADANSKTNYDPGRGLTMGENAFFIEPLMSDELQQLFSRACYRIRQGLELDGVMIIDACFQDDSMGNSTPGSAIQSSTRTTRNPHLEASTKGSETSDRAMLTDVLGHSIEPKVKNFDLPFATGQVPLRRSTLQSLLQTYREGNIFAFDRDCVLLHIDGAERSNPSDNHDLERLKGWAGELEKVCPGAKSIMFFPLWDNHFDQWFAGALAWTTDYTRIIRASDVNYLTAFTSCVMSEKSRLDVMAADQEKLDFISSVSHELRSPLHGILASMEALQETSTGLLQDDMMRTVTVCREVLWDTMDQMSQHPSISTQWPLADICSLDYAKMSEATRTAKPASKSNTGTPSSRKATLKNLKPLDLSEIIESAVESVFFGHDFHKSTFGTFEDLKQTESNYTHAPLEENKVMLILNIAKEESWIFKSQVNAWTRILMNLFGNALKYTYQGFVKITLRSDPPSPRNPSAPYIVTLEIEDSGKGMSDNYLKYHVFTPFVQEDQMAVGTGLGLSIVRQLIRDLGGQINIKSEVKQGTKVTVSVPLLAPSDIPISEISDNESLIADVRSRARGLKLCLIDFDYYPDVDEAPTGILSAQSKSMLALKESLKRMAIDWFEMEVTTGTTLASAAGNVLVGLRSKLALLEGHANSIPLIIFEDTTESRLLGTKRVHYLSMPAGPHKFARALKVCLDSKLSAVASMSASTREETPSIIRSPRPSIHRSTSMTQSPLLSPSLPVLSRTNTTEALQSPVSIPALDHPKPQHPVPLNAVSKRLLDHQEDWSASEDMMSVSPVAISISPAIPLRNKALLVEDNAVNLKILMHCMRSAKQEYVTATNGLEALEQYQADPGAFKIIFMDLSMPIMDGLTSTRHIRAYEEEQLLSRTRIVALTCFSSEKYQRDAIESGVDLYIVKPIPMKSLKPILALDPDDFEPTPTLSSHQAA